MSRTDEKNSSRYWFDQQTSGLSLLCADFTTHEYPAHIHDALMVAVTETGGSEIQAGGGPDEAHSAALLVVNPAEPHSSRMNGSRRWQYRSFYLERSAIDDVLRGLGVGELPGFSRNMLKDSDLIRGFLALHHALDDGHADQLRLESARAALRRAMPIAEAAIQAGFYDQAALTRIFKRCYGITPLQFVQAARLSDTILPGITRDSVITLLQAMGTPVEERPVSIDEIVAAHGAGLLRECFGTGTAATISHVVEIGYQGKTLTLPPVADREIAPAILTRMTALRTGREPDHFGWLTPV